MGDNLVETEIEEMAKRLRLPHIRKSFAEISLTAKAQRWEPLEVIRTLFETEIAGRNNSTLQIRRAKANLPANKSLEGFDVSLSSIPSKAINSLTTLEWIKRKENLVITGPPGTGKSFLAEGLATLAIDNGMNVSYLTCESIKAQLKQAKLTDNLNSFLLKLKRLDLIVIDDIGILPIDDLCAESLYRTITTSYEVTSVIVTSNFSLSEFDLLFDSKTMVSALVDRLGHHAHLIETKGESIRLQHAISGKGVISL